MISTLAHYLNTHQMLGEITSETQNPYYSVQLAGIVHNKYVLGYATQDSTQCILYIESYTAHNNSENAAHGHDVGCFTHSRHYSV